MVASDWTIDRIIDSLPQKVKDYHKSNFLEERRNLFYGGIVDVLNIIQQEEWRLEPKFRKTLCGFFLTDKGIEGIKRVFGIILPTHLPYGRSVDRNGRSVSHSLVSTPPRLFVKITEAEAKQLEHQFDRCEFCAVSDKDSQRDYVYYHIPEDMSDLFPALEFAYRKHSGS